MLRFLASRFRQEGRHVRGLILPLVAGAASLAAVLPSPSSCEDAEVCNAGKEIEASRKTLMEVGVSPSTPAGAGPSPSALMGNNLGAALRDGIQRVLLSQSSDDMLAASTALSELLEASGIEAFVSSVSVFQVEDFARLLLRQESFPLHAAAANVGPGAGSAVVKLSPQAQVALLRILAQLTSFASLPAEKSPLVLAAAVSALELFGPQALSSSTKAAASSSACSSSSALALDGVRWSLATLSNAVAEEDVGLSHFGWQLLSILGRLSEMPVPLPSVAPSASSSSSSSGVSISTLPLAIKEEAALVLSGCLQLQAFETADIDKSGVIPVLARAIDPAASSSVTAYSSRGGRFACAAIRELSWRHPEDSAVGKALAKHKVARLLMHLVLSPSSNIWTRRAAAKAVSVVIVRKSLLEAAGLSQDEVMTALVAAGKDDFMCARAADAAKRAIAVQKARDEAAAAKKSKAAANKG